MNQAEKRQFLIRRLLDEQPGYRSIAVPPGEADQKRLLQSLCNVRLPGAIGEDFLAVQDAYLQEETRQRGVTEFDALTPIEPGIRLWQGDITTLACDAIVNAANSGMTGCYQPCHNCIDNCIHSSAGIQLRKLCAELMQRQGYAEPVGQAKLTPAFNLPCRYILHTVGPTVSGRLTKRHEEQLASCYRACLSLAAEHGLRSVAFCCISTGVFGFPRERAAEIAVQTVREFQANTSCGIEVLFNVFKDEDYCSYRALLG